MGRIVRTVHVRHGNGHLLGGLLHYVVAASNHTARGYRSGKRGRDLYRMAVHRTNVYQTRFADYIIRNIHGSHKAWRTHRLADPHARAPHYLNPVAQTDCFEMAFDDTARRWNGSPAIHVAIYGMGRTDRTWMAFAVPPYMAERLRRPGIRPKTVSLDRNEIYVTYEEDVPDREPAAWAGVDMNANNNTYACTDGTVIIKRNDHTRQYNAACCKILKVKRRGDRRVMAKYQAKAWGTYHNRVRNDIRVEARGMASAGYGVGHEELDIHRLFNKHNRMSAYIRGRLKSTLNVGQRKGALVNALEAEGLPHVGVDPAGTSAGCLMCGAKLKRSSVRPRSPSRDGRSMICQSCRVIRERDANAGANILFRTIMVLVMEYTGRSGSTRGVTLSAILEILREAVGHPGLTGKQRFTLSNILRLPCVTGS